ncbi:MAG: hypothetical protein RLZZ490_473 [Cyanobacteriota bacterium]
MLAHSLSIITHSLGVVKEEHFKNKPMNRPIVIDLFAGCGGMSLGLEAAGFDIGAAVEIDPIHALIHHVNFPYGATLCKDISQVKTSEILAALKQQGYSGEVDVIAGGPPCQGFSHMGKRQLDDPRNRLVFEYLRIVQEAMGFFQALY